MKSILLFLGFASLVTITMKWAKDMKELMAHPEHTPALDDKGYLADRPYLEEKQ